MVLQRPKRQNSADICISCCMYSYVPLMCALNEREPNSHGKLVNLWDQFVLHLLAAVDIIRAMPASYYSICDPMMSSGVWILGCVLSLCMMYKAHIVPAIGTQASVTRAEMETGFQALMDTLVGFAKMWPTARKMRGRFISGLVSPQQRAKDLQTQNLSNPSAAGTTSRSPSTKFSSCSADFKHRCRSTTSTQRRQRRSTTSTCWGRAKCRSKKTSSPTHSCNSRNGGPYSSSHFRAPFHCAARRNYVRRI